MQFFSIMFNIHVYLTGVSTYVQMHSRSAHNPILHRSTKSKKKSLHFSHFQFLLLFWHQVSRLVYDSSCKLLTHKKIFEKQTFRIFAAVVKTVMLNWLLLQVGRRPHTNLWFSTILKFLLQDYATWFGGNTKNRDNKNCNSVSILTAWAKPTSFVCLLHW